MDILSSKKALTPQNILRGFRATRIWPLNSTAMILKTTPSEAFRNQEQDKEEREKNIEEDLIVRKT